MSEIQDKKIENSDLQPPRVGKVHYIGKTEDQKRN